MKIFVWTKCNVNYLNVSFWPQLSIFILQICVLFGENNERNIQEGPNPGKILKKATIHTFPQFFVPHAFGRSLSLHILKSCWLWSWESQDWLVSPKAKVKFGALWSEGRILPSAAVCRMLPMVWEGMDTLRILLSLFECSLFLSVRFMIIKSIFL